MRTPVPTRPSETGVRAAVSAAVRTRSGHSGPGQTGADSGPDQSTTHGARGLTPGLLRALLGLPLSAPDAPPTARVLSSETRPDGTREDQVLFLPQGMRGTFLRPASPGPHPAILYCHAHGGEYSLGRLELTDGARWLSAPFAQDLLAAGFAVLAVDMPGFGNRREEGSEAALAKAGLWRGQPLFGQMVADQERALSWLRAQESIAAGQIATLGMSMGGALAFWLAAVSEHVSACAHMCMLADMAPLIEMGTHDRHGHYLTVPDLLTHGEIGEVAGLIAPRPQFAAFGESDHLTPPEARDAALSRLQRAYDATPGPLEYRIFPDTGHRETPLMRSAALTFLRQTLRAGAEQDSERKLT